MTVLTPDALARLVLPRRFANPAVAVAVALAESGGHTDAVRHNVGPPPSNDRGLWQINSRFHPEVTDAQALSPASAADAAFRISTGGTNWTPWNTYRNNAYARYLPVARAAVAHASKPTWWPGWIARTKPSVRLGVRDWSVAYLQSVLSVRAGQRVAVNGLFDAATDAAVRNLQRFFHLSVDGVVGRQQTWPIVDYLAST